MILEDLVNFLDKKYHHKRIIKFLSNYKIDIIIDVGAHKGEFLNHCKSSIKFKKAYTFEPQKNIFQILINNFNQDHRINHNNIALGDNNKKKIINISNLTLNIIAKRIKL